MSTGSKIAVALIAVVVGVFGLWWSIYISGRNVLVRHNNNLEATYTQVNNVAQKRLDLTEKLVAIVQGAANFESSTLKEVTDARSRATGITLPVGATPEQIAAFAAAQQQLSGALGRFIATAEAYPQLTATAGFRDLQKQYASIEGQMTAARGEYIRAVERYNNNVESWPWNGAAAEKYGFKKKPQLEFSDPNALKTAPKIEFKK